MSFTFVSSQVPGFSPAFALNPNPVFNDYPGAAGASAYPTGWSLWVGAIPTKIPYGLNQNAVGVIGGAGVDSGIQATIASFPGPGWYVLEAKIVLAYGALTGAGMLVNFCTDATFSTLTGETGEIDFGAMPDVSGVVHGAGSVGSTYSYRLMIPVKLTTSLAAVVYAMAHWSVYGAETVANQINFEQCSIRPATVGEIAAGNAQYGLPVFPLLPGQSIAVSKAPKWSTKVKRASSGRERRTALWPYPLWQFELSYEVVRARPTNGELAALWSFFNTVQGQNQPWLFLDPTDFQQTSPQIFGTGDGVTTTFQIGRTFTQASAEPVYAPFGITLFINGAAITAYTSAANGQVTFASAPSVGAQLAWTGGYYFGCRFLQDDLTLEQLVSQLWSGKSVKFTSLRV
jgi:uncharacterized protein (TIGR02217 family)